MTEVASRKRITHRATLAPGKFNVAEWSVGDFRQFVQDCEAQGISDETTIRPDPDSFCYSQGLSLNLPIIAERHTSLD